MKLQWDILLNDNSKFPRLLFFGEFEDDRFRYGIDEQLHCCLYFKFGDTPANVPIEPVIRANISLEEKTENSNSVLVLTLLNNNARSLFGDLILSIVTETRSATSSPVKAAFIAVCNEWFELFEPLSGQLSASELQGIFAELSFLKYLLIKSKFPFNDILAAWKGPYGKGHDFELGESHFEIKSITEFKYFVSISSEYQLDFLNGQQLVLGVFVFGTSDTAPFKLSEIILEIAAILRSVTGTGMNLFWIALAKTGLDYNTIHQYDHHYFNVKRILWYDCTADDFPAIIRANLPDAIRSVKYDIALNSINSFIKADILPLI